MDLCLRSSSHATIARSASPPILPPTAPPMIMALLELGLGCGVKDADAVGDARMLLGTLVALEMEVELLLNVVGVEINEDCVVDDVDDDDDDVVMEEEREETMRPRPFKATPAPCWQHSGWFSQQKVPSAHVCNRGNFPVVKAIYPSIGSVRKMGTNPSTTDLQLV